MNGLPPGTPDTSIKKHPRNQLRPKRNGLSRNLFCAKPEPALRKNEPLLAESRRPRTGTEKMTFRKRDNAHPDDVAIPVHPEVSVNYRAPHIRGRLYPYFPSAVFCNRHAEPMPRPFFSMMSSMKSCVFGKPFFPHYAAEKKGFLCRFGKHCLILQRILRNIHLKQDYQKNEET